MVRRGGDDVPGGGRGPESARRNARAGISLGVHISLSRREWETSFPPAQPRSASASAPHRGALPVGNNGREFARNARRVRLDTRFNRGAPCAVAEISAGKRCFCGG